MADCIGRLWNRNQPRQTAPTDPASATASCRLQSPAIKPQPLVAVCTPSNSDGSLPMQSAIVHRY